MKWLRFYLLLLLLYCTSIGYGQKNLFYFSFDADIGYFINNQNIPKNYPLPYDASLKAGAGIYLNETTSMAIHIAATYLNINRMSYDDLRFPIHHDGRGGWITPVSFLSGKSKGLLLGQSIFIKTFIQ